MLRMIIIEDEKLEREGLVEFFDWSAMEIQIIGTACDGIEGMALAKKTEPDIIITDIKMPGMNGLDMSKKIKEILPETKIIILTGYADFNFAKQAIGMSISAYILKPIEEKELISTVKNIVLECKKNKNMEMLLGKAYYNEKTEFLIALLQGRLEIERLEKESLNFGINICSQAELIIIAIKPIIDEDETFGELSLQIKRMVNKNICFLVSREEEKTIFICACEIDKQNIGLDGICESITKYIALLEMPCFIGIGTRVEDICEINKSALDAKKALEYGMFWYDSGVVYYKDVVYNNQKIGEFTLVGNEFLKQLIHAVVCSEVNAMQDTLREIFEFICQNKNVDKNYIYNYLYSVIHEASLILYSLNKNNEKSLTERNDFARPLLELKSLKLIKTYTYDFFGKVISVLNEKRNNKDEHMVKTVIKLIEERYMKGISLKDMAGEVYLSPNHLGNIFKKFLGKSFNDYLCNYRMGKARELLKDSNKKISIVAKEVGIPNTSYFCMVFKDVYGMSPREYQEMILRN